MKVKELFIKWVISYEMRGFNFNSLFTAQSWFPAYRPTQIYFSKWEEKVPGFWKQVLLLSFLWHLLHAVIWCLHS